MKQKNKLLLIFLAILILVLLIFAVWFNFFGLFHRLNGEENLTRKEDDMSTVIDLLPPAESDMLLETAMKERRSVRNYSSQAIRFEHISQILWSAQGITDEETGFRTVPSAGALYPLEIYLVSANVESLPDGVYHYDAVKHKVRLVSEGDYRTKLFESALEQSSIIEAPASIVITGVEARTAQRYGDRSMKYIYLEAGHAGQNISLQVLSLGMATVPIGAFHDQQLKDSLHISDNETPLYVFPLGYSNLN